MARIEAHTHIEAPPERVWEVLLDWEGQSRWMQDAKDVEVLTEHREGLGVTLRVKTDIAAGIVVTDDMTTVEWVEHQRIGMRHLGRIIQGVGAFELEPTPHGTYFTWWEEVAVPFGDLGHAVAEFVFGYTVERVFRRSVAALKRVCESPAVRPDAA